MAGPHAVPVLYQETGLSPEIIFRDSIVHIDTSNTSQSLFSPGRKRHFDEIEEHDEESYARKHLASESAIHFRRKEHNPRTILWRLLDDRQLLELQRVDLIQTKQRRPDEGSIAFRVALPAPAVKNGVALADIESGGALEVFVLCSSNDLYTITLKRDLLLRDQAPKDFDPSTCIQKHPLSGLSFRNPYKFVAVSATELLISLQDGSIVRLERDSSSHSASWKETFYSEGGWTGTLRGLIPLKRHQTVRYGDIDLEAGAAVALATSPEQRHIWTVTLEHELVAWSTKTGKIVARRDILQPRQNDSKKAPIQYLMPAEQGSLLKIFDARGASDHEAEDSMQIANPQYQIMVYSPKERAFKLFFAKSGSDDDETPRLYDVMQGEKLSLPFDDLLNSNIWRCTDFQCKVDPHWQTLQLWTNIQCGEISRLYTITMNLFDEDELVDGWQPKWQSAWVAVAEPSIKGDLPTPEIGLNFTSPSESWLRYLFYPGRYSRAELETALSTYKRIRKLQPKFAPPRQTSLQERISAAVSAKNIIANTPQGQSDYDRYYTILQEQWHAFHSILLDLQGKRLGIRSIALDDDNDMAWIVRAESFGPVRASDRLERLTRNTCLEADDEAFGRIDQALRDTIVASDEEWEHAKLLAAVNDFSEALPRQFRQAFAEQAISESHAPSPDPKRATAFFQGTDVGQYVSDDAYQRLEIALQPLNGIGALTNDIFTSLSAAINESHKGVKSSASLDSYGVKFMVASGQHFIHQTKQLLLDLLALVTFINNDFDAEGLDEAFDAPQLYIELVKDLRNIELRDWLTRNTCVMIVGQTSVTRTIMEAIFLGDWDSHAPKTLSLAEKLTHWSRRWVFESITNWHGFTANVFATLLRQQLYDLAADFACFLQDSPWTTYLRARLHLALGELDEATAGFRRAAKGLSSHIKGEYDGAGFLSAEEISQLGQGPEMYYLHVASLYEKLRLYASTADFARQAMGYMDEAQLDRDFELVDGRKKSMQNQPNETIANARAEIKLLQTRETWESLVSRCFNALVQTGRYKDAYTVCQKFKTAALRKDNFKKLIDNCMRNNMLQTVLELPLDDNAADVADAHLLNLAKKAMSSGSTTQIAQRVLYSFRTKRGDFRAAAQVLYEQLERLRHQSNRKRLHDPEDETLPQAYLTLINTLACCGEGEEWLLADPIEGVHSPDQRRKLVTLVDVRHDYNAELDRRSDLLHGRFPVVGGDDDDEMEYL